MEGHMKVKKKHIFLVLGMLLFCLGSGFGYYKGTQHQITNLEPEIIQKKSQSLTENEVVTKQPSIKERALPSADYYEEDYRSEETVIPFDIIAKPDAQVTVGEDYIEQRGQEGRIRTVYKDLYKNNELIESTVHYTETVQAPIAEVHIIGKKENVQNNEKIDREASILMFEAVNQTRKEHQLEPLAWSEALYDYAGIRAVDLEQRFEHRRPDGSSWDSLNPNMIFAENLAKRAFTVESAMEGFMNSPSHRANILDDFTSGACALFEAEDGNWYWVQLFGY